MAFTIYQQDFDLAVGAVVFGIGGPISEDVLVANGVVDGGEDIRKFALKDGIETETSGHGGEGLELVLGLEIVHVTHGSPHATLAAIHLVQEGASSNGEDGDVGSCLDLGKHRVESDLGESVTSRADENDVFLTFDAADAIERLVECVEHIGVGETGDGEGLERFGDDAFIVGKVGEDVGAQIVCDDGDVVVGAQGLEEGIGGVLHLVDEVIAVGGELKQHDSSDGLLSNVDAGDGLRYSVFKYEEVAGHQSGDELMGLVEDDIDVEVDDGDVYAERVVGATGVFDSGFGWCRRGRRLVSLIFLSDDNGAVVGLRTCLSTGVVGGRGLLL